MQANAELLIPVFFKVLLAFILINMFINFFLLLTKQLRIYKFLSFYWPVLLGVYVIQSIYQTGTLAIVYAYSVNILACSIFASIGFEVVKRRFPYEKYILYFLPFFPITYYLHHLGHDFVIVAMPFAIATATPLVHAFYYVFIIDRHKTTALQKFLACIYLAQAIHCINFAIFRMVEGTQVWGWLVAYALYDLAAIILPAIALEQASITENERLTGLVEARTSELNSSLKENESLLKVVLHDISSPLMTMRFYLHYLKVNPENADLIEKTKKSHSAMEKIIHEVKNLYGKKSRKEKLNLQPVCIEECFNDVSFIFAQKLEKKKIDLVFVNLIKEKVKVMADQTTLTHSVISNLVSNSLKFSYPNSQIRISISETHGMVTIEIQDQGPGIPPEIIQSINNEEELTSSEGTYGETGTGFGLSIVKSFVDAYGGNLEFVSKLKATNPNDHGTNIKITLQKA